MSDTSGNKQRLLIVDDSKVIRVTARKILQDHFETVEAVDGNNAWEILNEEAPFSLIVSDLTMPGLDGFGLLEKIRGSHLPHLSNIPVIIITGANDSEATKQRATDAGATDFIGKPFDAVHLLARTQAHADAYATELSLTQETMALEDQALVDPVSGLPNETAFMERGYQQLAYAVRHRSDLALFCIGIDDYSEIFSRHGEDVTLPVIKSVAGVLSSCIRQEDMAARIGTARFALLLPGMNNSGIRKLADRIISDVSAQCMEVDGTAVHCTVSVGVSAPEIAADIRFTTLIATATANLQAAMDQGGNRVVHADTAPASTPPATGNVPEVAATGTDAPTPDIECAAQQPAEPAAGDVSGPLPDLEVVGTLEDAVDSPSPENHGGMAFSPEDYEEETIVITAPGEYYVPDEQPETAGPVALDAVNDDSANPDQQPADSTEPAAAGSTTTAAEETAEIPDAGKETRRKGLLSRLWARLTGKH